jgi:protein-S-isoprenylcysteine O-methyltransferase Ste14
MTYVKRFLHFWYDFIIGDDWKIAVAVVLSLAITGAVMAWVDSSGGSLTPWTVFGAGLVLGFFAISILIDARRKGSKT